MKANKDQIAIASNAQNKGQAMEDLIKSGVSFKDAEAIWKEHGAGSKQRGFRALFYKELESHDMSKDEVQAFCEKHGSANDAKQYTHYVAIAELVAEVRNSK